MEDYSVLQDLISLIKEVSPVVWEAAKRQVYAQAISDLVGCILYATLIFVLVRSAIFTGRKALATHESNKDKDYLKTDDSVFGWSISTFLLFGISFFLCIVTIDSLARSSQMLYAPDYHAIRLLLEIAKK